MIIKHFYITSVKGNNMTEQEDLKKLYKLGKSIRGIGTGMLWSTFLCPMFMIFSMFLPIISFQLIEISFYLVLGWLGLAGIFALVIVIQNLLMIIRGFSTGSALDDGKFTAFSVLQILSYLVTAILIAILLTIIGAQIMSLSNTIKDAVVLLLTDTMSSPIWTDPLSFFNTIFEDIGDILKVKDLLLYAPIIGTVTGYILRMMSWGKLKKGLKNYSDERNIKKAARGCTRMTVSMFFLGVFNVMIFISSFVMLLGTIVVLVLALPYLIFYILQISAYRKIGKRIKRHFEEDKNKSKTPAPNQPQTLNVNINYNQKDMTQPTAANQSYNFEDEDFDQEFSTAYCPSCGKENDEGSKFCKTCGQRLM
ncbi:MAG: zinc-ribbon domain-containing protein [Candidatus Lokiarchaeota archaeon]|nr:zinc-ribbon domain-containing protein [Candidatus Lokiarchaeota archaeon]